jgi:NAD(P)-dependent dehydrogenase (short-subunit alcohol dehydrogenase family)
MDLNRINPVTLITGAASKVGAAYVRDLAKRSQGGLLLVDADDAALSTIADDLDARSISPERVSTLALDVCDPARWAQAIEFIRAQYGRVDWAVVAADPAAPNGEDSDLVDWGRIKAMNVDGLLLTLRSLMPLMRANAQGGAIAVSASAAAIKPEQDVNAYAASRAGLIGMMRIAAAEGAINRVRVNAIAHSGAQTPVWPQLPWFSDLVRDHGSERAALVRLGRFSAPLARYAESEDLVRLMVMLLSDDTRITGATLVVDGGQPM